MEIIVFFASYLEKLIVQEMDVIVIILILTTIFLIKQIVNAKIRHNGIQHWKNVGVLVHSKEQMDYNGLHVNVLIQILNIIQISIGVNIVLNVLPNQSVQVRFKDLLYVLAV